MELTSRTSLGELGSIWPLWPSAQEQAGIFDEYTSHSRDVIEKQTEVFAWDYNYVEKTVERSW